ncbi:gamma-butyrobetaine dioxygenase [Parasteatoda tepidariorum]|uniref:gamma-butyrobetaine dioxygenase n=1 Tax=Parasteatoda tepidariorum TaxID=114398 RepID=UPI00077FC43C|nr:gamma-butyrobetaine dioxygenase [Parasteatoda tepidariorum]
MSLKALSGFCKLVGKNSTRKILNPANFKIKTDRNLHITGSRFGVTAAIDTKQPATITKTFPTAHQSLQIGFHDNLASDFQFIWLRDNCKCSKCVHPDSKQKMLDTVSLDINIKPKSYHLTEKGMLKIIWPDTEGDHVSLYDPTWLHKYGKGFELDSHESIHDDNLPAMIPWDRDTIQQIKPEVNYEEVMETEEGLKKWLENIYKYGLAIMKGVPRRTGEVINVMERVAYVKKTKWGSSFDVKCEPVQNDPKHLAFTGMYLEHHTDMNYLEKSPGLQALLCMKANPAIEGESIGGQSFFVDGFHIAKWLRKEHPSSFHVLTSTLVEFKIHSHNMEYCNNQYVLHANKSGDIQEVHYNTRTMSPLKGPKDTVQAFYGAYQLFGQKMREPESEYMFNLVPGDLVAFNNRRILHGRTSFDPRKVSRHLEGCYGDIDEVFVQYKSFMKNSDK